MSDQPKVYAPDAGWRDMAEGGIIPQAGNAVEYSTGAWRLQKPVRRDEDCIDCLFCWVYCPDGCIAQGAGPVIDLTYCKGCGICAQECPAGAIEMVPEALHGACEIDESAEVR